MNSKVDKMRVELIDQYTLYRYQVSPHFRKLAMQPPEASQCMAPFSLTTLYLTMRIQY